jgi:hypothetical protein
MAQILTVAGSASLPFEDGTNVAPVQLAATLGFTSRADFARAYSGAITDDAIDFGTLSTPGAKGVLVKCTAGSCTIKFEAIDGTEWPLAPGGYFLWINTAQAFPKAAFITTTGAASVVFIAVG